MPPRKPAQPSPDAVSAYRHDATRKNIPPSGLAAQGRIAEVPKIQYAYDPHLPPALRFDPTGAADALPELLAVARTRALTDDEARQLTEALRRQQPWLEWSGKREKKLLEVDPVALHIHERVSAQAILAVAKKEQVQRSLFADPEQAYREAVQFYRHDVDWANRMILGDSLQVMASLARREDLAGKVQMIYLDPPYGIKFASNFQPEIGKRDVKDKESDLTREPEMVKAYRDTWTLGVHSYLAYLRDRLVVARELLADTGSIFVQISDENLHRVRAVMDEVFGAENFVSVIQFVKTSSASSDLLATVTDFLLWYARDKEQIKYRPIYGLKVAGQEGASKYDYVILPSGERRILTPEERDNPGVVPAGGRVNTDGELSSQRPPGSDPFEFQGGTFRPAPNFWKTSIAGLNRLAGAGRVIVAGNKVRYIRYLDDFAAYRLNNLWADIGSVQSRTDPKIYVVQTATSVIQRCLLMTTDPGDLVLDPTCGSGTTAYVAEQWGRRWITIDTSRVALALARQRLLTAKFDYYRLRPINDEEAKRKQGGPWLEDPTGAIDGPCTLQCRSVPHITLKSIAQNTALDAIFARHQPILDEKLAALNAALSTVTPELRQALKTKLLTKQQREGKRAVTDADVRRWELPKERWEEWQVPFDADEAWPPALQQALHAYRAAWRAKMDAVNAAIAASAEQEELVDQPDPVRGINRVSGPFTMEAVMPAALSLDASPIGGEPEELETFAGGAAPPAAEPANAEAFLDRMVRLLRADGVRFPNNKTLAFERLEPVPGDPFVHAEGEWRTEEGQIRRVAVSIGPEQGAVTAYQDERFPAAALVVCPNLTIKERLQVLRPDSADDYYTAFEVVPSQLMPELKKGKVLITNWHRFSPESPHSEGGKTYAVVNKGEEGPDAFAQRVLGELYERAPLMVLNDEAHHAYRPAPIAKSEKLSADAKSEREEATVWIAGLDRINKACGVRFCVDLSATPFYLAGSGYVEGSPFPWLVSDFGLVDAIESGIVKIPRLPVSDNTGRPDPKYFKLWQAITAGLQPGEKLPGGKPKPEVVWRDAEDALLTLASQYKERFELVEAASPGQDRSPPVLIVVCDNTDIARLFYERISGEQQIEVAQADDEDDEDDEAPVPTPKKRGKAKQKVVYGTGKPFPELFSNREGFRPTLRIDSKLLSEAESDDPGVTRSEAADALREVVATIGRPGKPGEQVRCVVSVQMLTEGWDANNVTHILGLRAFDSQLLCEQVVGRGLRRMSYDVDPETGLLPEEYVDIYGVPFSLIPFKGRDPGAPVEPGVDTPKNKVCSLPERKHLEIRFPVVEGYAFALSQDLIKADIRAMEPLQLEPARTPTAVFVQPQVGYKSTGGLSGGFDTREQDRQEYYDSTHLQTIKFEIARQVVWLLTEGAGQGTAKRRLRSRHQLFPQVYRLVDEYVRRKVDLHGCDPCELGLETYMVRTVERLMDAIEPDDAQGEPPLLPILNRYKPYGSTADVDFLTKKPCFPTQHSHINQVVADTKTWEQTAAFRLEQAAQRGIVSAYAKNDHLEFTIPYEYLGVSHAYVPDFLVRLRGGATLVLEIKGLFTDQDRAKHQAAQRWRSAVNTWGQLGRWEFHVCSDPQLLLVELETIARRTVA